jgi:hypothetical protein
MGFKVPKKYFDIKEWLLDNIKDDYAIYKYNYDKKEFEDITIDDEELDNVIGIKTKYEDGKITYEFGCNNTVFICHYQN